MKNKLRPVGRITQSRPTIEGAGVRLRRALGYSDVPLFDPFLMLDDFGSANPDDYLAGFPWHPHRGIETVTYMLEGEFEHGDSLGNRGLLRSGDVQWMTAGGGIIHQEMPKKYEGVMRGFQLWVNLPSSKKMMEPRYRGIEKKDILETEIAKGVRAKLISGKLNGRTGTVKDLVVPIEYFDFFLEPGTSYIHETRKEWNAFCYVIEGTGLFGKEERAVSGGHLVHFENGENIRVITKKEPLRFLFASGPRIGEPVAWGGPIVMNTQEELELAFAELNEGTFLKGSKNSAPASRVSGSFYRK